MNSVLALVLLTSAMMVMSVTAEDSAEIVSFRKPRMVKKGPGMCALDAAFKTILSSSLQDCSVSCAHDDSCTGFNMKGSQTCGLYDQKPKINSFVSNCEFYQVSTILYCRVEYCHYVKD